MPPLNSDRGADSLKYSKLCVIDKRRGNAINHIEITYTETRRAHGNK